LALLPHSHAIARVVGVENRIHVRQLPERRITEDIVMHPDENLEKAWPAGLVPGVQRM